MSLLHRYKELGIEFDPSTIELKSCLRVNTLKIDPDELIARLREKSVIIEKVPFLKNGYYFEADFTMSSCEEYLLGYFYIQEAASQLPVMALFDDVDSSADDFDPLIADLCAAPGSKTTQIAQTLNQKGIIFALDNHIQRLNVLHHNLERLGIKNVISIRKEAQFADDLNKKFDYILLDAPCSGNFCIEKNYFDQRNLIDIRERAKVQKELLKTAYKILKPGATLVYSTCSLEPEENEMMMDWFIKKYDDVSLVETGLGVGDNGFTKAFTHEFDSSLALTKRIWPHKTGMQGFFIAKLTKSL